MKKLAIVGVTGLVGQSVLNVLREENLSNKFEIFMFCSERSAGTNFEYNGKTYELYKLDETILNFDLGYAIFLTDEAISRIWVKELSDRGTIVVDNSSAFRLAQNIPLVVPEINFKEIRTSDKIISNPNCSTIQLVIVLDRLLKLSKIATVVVSSYQSVSGAGKDALLDLKNKTNNIFECGIQDNFIASIGKISDNLNCSEENKIILETKKILNQEINVIATTVRVPISFCHGESVYIKFEKSVNLEDVKKVLECDYIVFGDDLFYPSQCVGSNQTFVCRLRQHSDTEIVFFVIADNLRRGASYNAIQILKKLEGF